MAKARKLIDGSPIRLALLSREFGDEEYLRSVAGDFLKGEALDQIGSPFGRVSFYPNDRYPKRKPSALKLRAIQVDKAYRLLALWDSRDSANLERGVSILVDGNKEIGHLLQENLSKLTT